MAVGGAPSDPRGKGSRVIRLEDLAVQAGEFRLEIDHLALEQGEFLVVLGPTGAGKSVLLETIAGLRRVERGEIWLDDEAMSARPPERRPVALVYQDYALFPHLDVAENIGFGLAGRSGVAADEKKRTVLEHARLVGMEDLLDRRPATLSGGEQQRVALARALVRKPRVLLMDEPLSALDPQSRGHTQALLKRLHVLLGPTVVHVTHHFDEALVLADRLAVLIQGRLRQVDVPDEVLRHPTDPETARFLAIPNVIPVTAGRGEARTAEGTVLRSTSLREGELHAVIRAEEIRLWPVAASDPPGTVVAGGSGTYSEGGAMFEGTWLEGTVTGIAPGDGVAAVTVDVPPALVVRLLNPEVRRLGLAPGERVALQIPSAAVHLC